MSCCGGKRETLYNNKYNQSDTNNEFEINNEVAVPKSFYFKYLSSKPLTIKGEITGNIYQFHDSEITIQVDRRDGTFMTGMPLLQRIENP